VFLDLYPGLVRHLTFLLGERAAAEDIAQEAFLRLFSQPPRRAEDPKAWLHVVAVRLAYNYLRGERRRHAREDAAWTDRALAPRVDAQTGADGGPAIRAALDALGPRDRLLLGLRAAGRPYREIAEALGVRPSSVGQLVARASERLRRAYAGQQESAGTVPSAGTLSAEGMRTR
jgi:RNA polymerase sigma factor (sigma-70 family)